jgi:hypothetical protein
VITTGPTAGADTAYQVIELLNERTQFGKRKALPANTLMKEEPEVIPELDGSGVEACANAMFESNQISRARSLLQRVCHRDAADFSPRDVL